MKKSIGIRLCIIIIFFDGCGKIVYTPQKSSIPEINISKARKNLTEAISIASINNNGKFLNIKWNPRSVEIKYQKSEAQGGGLENCFIDFEIIKIPNIKHYTGAGIPDFLAYSVELSEVKFYPTWRELESAKKFIDALYILKNTDNKSESIKGEQEIEKFKIIAEEYCALNVKPKLSEEQRKYIVQATSLAEDKNYEEAIELYKKAIAVDQTYPQAHFNQALLLAQIGRYDEAIIEMKKYLLLDKKTKDARASQDKIYEWEGKIGK